MRDYKHIFESADEAALLDDIKYVFESTGENDRKMPLLVKLWSFLAAYAEGNADFVESLGLWSVMIG